VDITRDVMRLYQDGKEIDAIHEYVVNRYGKYGASTDGG
jgi:cytochrome c-type biogenesis protein CcmH/NrfF